MYIARFYVIFLDVSFIQMYGRRRMDGWINVKEKHWRAIKMVFVPTVRMISIFELQKYVRIVRI